MSTKELQVYLDKSAIHELLANYAICVDTGDADGFAALFTSSCHWDWPAAGLAFRGRDALRKVAEAVNRHAPGTQHAISNTRIDVCGDHATSICQFNCFLSTAQQIHCLMLGYYTDELVRHGNGWLINQRLVKVENPELLSMGDIGELFAPLAEALHAIAQSSVNASNC